MDFESCPECGKAPKVEWHFSGWYTAHCDCYKTIGSGNDRLENYADCMNSWNEHCVDLLVEARKEPEKTVSELTLEQLRQERLRRLNEELEG